ncbi:efflux RND transporter periplasmic adaptor subunit [Brevundimonas diminuta]|uniref:efflux RND transporter periplasmic adaptor subunit n=1 Tax=Brevundimonas diminuta TaxID=293 RepID=UPI00320A6ACD
MAHFLERLKSRKVQGALAVVAVLTAGAAFGLMRGEADEGAMEEQRATMTRAPFVVSVNFSGRVTPGERIDLSAPFDARVTRVLFEYGDQIDAGQRLLELDAADVLRSRAEAESAWLKADAEADRMAGWEGGVEVRRATRTIAAAEADLSDLETKIAETQALLERGLVPRSEHEGLLQQRRQREAALVSAREDLAETLRRASAGEKRLASLQRAVAATQYDAVRDGGDGVIIAPQGGVIVRPQSQGENADKVVRTGGRVAKGQSLAVIASTAALDVVFTLDEQDLNAIQPGQRAVVTGPGFGGQTLTGVVTGVAGEASTDAGANKAVFEARVRLDPLSTEAARAVRIGMTANISIVAYENPSALVAPPEAVQGAAPNAFVMVRARGAEPVRRDIVVGQVGPMGVEVLSGLKAGDVVVWTPPPQSLQP